MPDGSFGNALGYCGGGETLADPYLPFVDHCADRVMLLSDGSVLGMAALAAAPFPLLSARERNAHHLRHTAFINAISDSNVEISEHLVRHEMLEPMPARPAEVSPYAAMFLNDWHGSIRPVARVNQWFLSILVKPRKGPFSAFGSIARALPFRRSKEEARPAGEADPDLLSQLEDAFSMAGALLRNLRPRRLGVRWVGPEGDEVAYSEIAEALELIRTTKSFPQPMVARPGTLGAGLALHDPIANRSGFEVRYGPGATDSHYGTMMGVIAYPQHVSQDRLDDLLNLEGSFVLTNHLRPFNRAEASEDIARIRRLMNTADDPDDEAAVELRSAMSRVARGEKVRGLSRWSLALHSGPLPGWDVKPTEAPELRRRRRAASAMHAIDRLVAEAKTAMVNAGVRIGPEGLGNKSSHIAQTPGAPRKNRIRPARIPTDYFTSLSTLAGFATGAGEFRWGGPLFQMLTMGGTLYNHDQAVGDVLHQTVLGPNGSGKTVWIGACITALDALIRAGRRCGTQILLDVDESNAQTILALGGSYTAIRGGGDDSGVVPLRLPDSRRVRAMLRSFIAGLTMMEGGAPLTEEEVRGLREGVDFVMGELPPEQRRLGTIRQYMGFAEGGAGGRLERWCADYQGDLAWAFDGAEHLLDFDVPLAGVDLTGVLEDAAVMPPMGQFLLWLASQQMDGRRCVLWCEETPAYIARPEFASMGKALVLRARKRNACFVAIAQMAEHLLATEAGKAIIKQSRQIVAFKNEGADEDVYCRQLGFSKPVFDMIKRGMFELPYRSVAIVRSDGQSTINRFDLSGLPRHLAVLSGTTNSIKLLRSIWAARGSSDPIANLEEFWRRLPEAAA